MTQFYVVLAAVTALAIPATAFSQLLPRQVVQQRAQEVDHLFNWYYASVFGTGFYRIGEESDLAALSLGGDLGFPLNLEFSGRQVVLGVQLIGTVYFNNLDFLMPRTGREEVAHEGEVALTLGVRRAFEVLGVGFDRVGIGFRKGSNGLRGVRLVGSFPF